jgi:hypothetical protein
MNALKTWMQSAAAGIVLVVAITGVARAEPQEKQIRLAPSDIAAMATSGPGAGTSRVAGIETTVLSGDPTAAGPYTIALRVPAHTGSPAIPIGTIAPPSSSRECGSSATAPVQTMRS